MAENQETLLRAENLSVRYPTPKGVVHAVRHISFTLGQEKLGIVGESGSGKSTVGRAILGLIPPPGIITADCLHFAGQDVLALNENEMRKIRGQQITMVLQDPTFSLNPVMRIGDQIVETLTIHGTIRSKEARQLALEILAAVRIRDPQRVLRAYPHELSGGMGRLSPRHRHPAAAGGFEDQDTGTPRLPLLPADTRHGVGRSNRFLDGW